MPFDGFHLSFAYTLLIASLISMSVCLHGVLPVPSCHDITFPFFQDRPSPNKRTRYSIGDLDDFGSLSVASPKSVTLRKQHRQNQYSNSVSNSSTEIEVFSSGESVSGEHAHQRFSTSSVRDAAAVAHARQRASAQASASPGRSRSMESAMEDDEYVDVRGGDLTGDDRSVNGEESDASSTAAAPRARSNGARRRVSNNSELPQPFDVPLSNEVQFRRMCLLSFAAYSVFCMPCFSFCGFLTACQEGFQLPVVLLYAVVLTFNFLCIRAHL